MGRETEFASVISGVMAALTSSRGKQFDWINYCNNGACWQASMDRRNFLIDYIPSNWVMSVYQNPEMACHIANVMWVRDNDGQYYHWWVDNYSRLSLLNPSRIRRLPSVLNPSSMLSPFANIFDFPYVYYLGTYVPPPMEELDKNEKTMRRNGRGR